MSTDEGNDASISDSDRISSNIRTRVTPVRHMGEGRSRDGKRVHEAGKGDDLGSKAMKDVDDNMGRERMLVRTGEGIGEDTEGQAFQGTRVISTSVSIEGVKEFGKDESNPQVADLNSHRYNERTTGPLRKVDDENSVKSEGGLTVEKETEKETGVDQSCPQYLKYTMEDLHPWVQRGGISSANLEAAAGLATFRVQVVNESVYIHEWGVSMPILNYDCLYSGGDFLIGGNVAMLG